MGSSPSKNEVVHIRISSSKGRENTSSKSSSNSRINSKCDLNTKVHDTSEVKDLQKELATLKNQLQAQQEKFHQAEEMSFSFQSQLDEREREILLLREEIESLQHPNEESIFKDNSRRNSEENFDRTIQAKDLYINTLEDELKNIRLQTNTQNDKYQKKVKKLKATLSKSRQDSSLKLFELKDENTKLCEENTKLQERLERFSMDSGEFSRQSSATSTRSIQKLQHTPQEDAQQEDLRLKLILELSEQVAALDSENTKLKQELRHCKKIAEKVEKVRIQKKKNPGRDFVVVDETLPLKGMDSLNYSKLTEIGEKA